jgi:hypothetical protein
MKKFAQSVGYVCAFIALKASMPLGGFAVGFGPATTKWLAACVLGAFVSFLLSPWVETWLKRRRRADW